MSGTESLPSIADFSHEGEPVLDIKSAYLLLLEEYGDDPRSVVPAARKVFGGNPGEGVKDKAKRLIKPLGE